MSGARPALARCPFATSEPVWCWPAITRYASIDAVDRVFQFAGASANMADHPLQRCFRDIHIANTHLFWSDARSQAVARVPTSTSPNRRFPCDVRGVRDHDALFPNACALRAR